MRSSFFFSLQSDPVILVVLSVDKGDRGVEGWIVPACPGELSEEQKNWAVGRYQGLGFYGRSNFLRTFLDWHGQNILLSSCFVGASKANYLATRIRIMSE